MTNSFQIKCINKLDRLNPHERILHAGGILSNGSRWKRSQKTIIELIDSGANKFYVSVGGKSVWVEVRTKHGNKYIRTEADGEDQNNLLGLPECPA